MMCVFHVTLSAHCDTIAVCDLSIQRKSKNQVDKVLISHQYRRTENQNDILSCRYEKHTNIYKVSSYFFQFFFTYIFFDKFTYFSKLFKPYRIFVQFCNNIKYFSLDILCNIKNYIKILFKNLLLILCKFSESTMPIDIYK